MGKVIETVSDSIAIEILDKGVLLISKGNELNIYSKSFGKENVFEAAVLPIKLKNKIHGIKASPNPCDKIVLIYGEKEFAFLEYDYKFQFNEVYRAELSDWITCGWFLNEAKEVVLLTAHSIILRLEYNIADRQCCIKERVSCADKSTLYCGHIFGEEWNKLIVFAGNAFGELLIWQPCVNEQNIEDPLKPSVSPLLHRISAHNGVIFSIDFNQKSLCVVTTSDDRSIKWWEVSFANNSTDWSMASLQALSSGYGHVARVFQGRVINDGPNVFALSAGEDSYFCLWNKKCELIFKRRHQYGAIIWNFLYDYNSKTIYTIGSTGNLVAFGLGEALKENQNSIKAILLPTLSDNSTEYIAKVKFLTQNNIIGLTNQNKLMTARFINDKWERWEMTAVKVEFKCTVMEVYHNVIAVCGYKRLMLLEKQEKSGDFVILLDEEVLKSVIRTFIFLQKDHYLVCDDSGNCVLFANSVKRYLELPKSKEPWLTMAALLNKEQHIAISNRQGHLLLYKLHSEIDVYKLQHIIRHPHGNLGATYIKCIEEMNGVAVLWSTSHDGTLHVFSVDFLNNTMKTCTRQIIPVAWIEHVEKFCKGVDLFLGFNDNHFVVWCKNYDFLLQIACGGGHRCWSFALSPNNDTISLVFVKNKRVHFYKMTLLNKELMALPLAKRWHTAPCNAVEILRQTSLSNPIAVSAGDDNLIKIHVFDKHKGIEERKELHCHISNVKCLRVVWLNEKEFLIFSGGGRAQLCVCKVNACNFHINELINYTLKDKSHNNCKSELYNFDPETRLMALDLKVVNTDEYEIYVGCSDGFIKHLTLNLQKTEIQIITKYFYNKCILQLRYLPEPNLVAMAATDGLLSLFDGTLSKCLHQLQHHHSGINGLSLLYDILNESIHVLSGGDDQIVSYTKLSLKASSFAVINHFNKPYLHSSQVCGCAISSDGLYGFTSGIDQVIYKLDLSTGEIIDSFLSCVADVKGVVLIEDNLCLLYGSGFQIYNFKS